MTWPVLYHRGKKGAIYQWSVRTKGNVIITEYGQVDGAMQIARKKAVGKNKGKANETSDDYQADLEAEAMYKFKLARKYHLSEDELESPRLRPMLAQDFAKRRESVTYPIDVQPKLDGNRCLTFWQRGKVVLMSRSGKEWNLPHLREQLESCLPVASMLDGELYNHGKSCQQMTKLIKSHHKHVQATVQYHVYDMPFEHRHQTLSWLLRRAALESWYDSENRVGTPNVILVPTYRAKSEADVMHLHAKMVHRGYEGAILRERDGLYEFGYRSAGLLKVKAFDDSEFKIVGFKEGKGKNEGTVTWRCKTKSGEEFDCAATGIRADRARLFRTGKAHIGKWLKVKHQGLTDDGIPRFPIGLGLRDEEDMER